MRVENQSIRAAIDEYVANDPTGEHVTAHVLDAIGEQDFRSYIRSAHLNNADAGKKELGALVKTFLIEKFPSVTQLGVVKVDPKSGQG